MTFWPYSVRTCCVVQSCAWRGQLSVCSISTEDELGAPGAEYDSSGTAGTGASSAGPSIKWWKRTLNGSLFLAAMPWALPDGTGCQLPSTQGEERERERDGPVVGNRDRLVAAHHLAPRAEPLVVAAAGEELELVRVQAEVRVDEVLLAPPRRRAAHHAEVVHDRLDVAVDEADLAHLGELEQGDPAVDLERLELALVGARRWLPRQRTRGHVAAHEAGRNAPMQPDGPAQVWVALADVAHVDAHRHERTRAVDGLAVARRQVRRDRDVRVEVQDALGDRDDVGEEHFAMRRRVDVGVGEGEHLAHDKAAQRVVVGLSLIHI